MSTLLSEKSIRSFFFYKTSSHKGSSKSKELVVIIHGFLGNALSMEKMAELLRERHGYSVARVDISTVITTTEKMEKEIRKQLESLNLKEYDKVHFFGFSFGGIIARAIASWEPIPNLGNIVTAGSPFGGSKFLNDLRLITPFIEKLFIVKNFDHLIEASKLRPLELSSKIGLIAGKKPYRRVEELVSGSVADLKRRQKILRGSENDGTVSVDEAHGLSEGEKLVVTLNHAELSRSPTIAKLANRFFKTGTFLKNPK